MGLVSLPLETKGGQREGVSPALSRAAPRESALGAATLHGVLCRKCSCCLLFRHHYEVVKPGSLI